MRFKKGSKVEVFTKKDMTCSGWRCGEIVSGNGHTYSVKFDCSPAVNGEDSAERVTRKAIRPCPPLMDGVECWSAGDVMEVFHEFCWKTAAVLKVLRSSRYLVRLIGSSKELKVGKTQIRTRLLWKDRQWIVINKGSGICDDGKSNKLSTQYTSQKIILSVPKSEAERRMQAGEVYLATENNAGFQESYIFSGRTLKRQSPFWSSVAESSNGKTHKVRAIEKNGERQRMLSRYPSLFSEKVDAVAIPQECLGEKFMYAPPENGHYELEREMPDYVIDFHERSSEPNDCDIDACSVGSCSVASLRPNKPYNPMLAGYNPEAETLSSDAESFYHGDNEERCSLPLGEDVAARIHSLELHAYRCTLDALYASGTLSWEQEALLTNLRISLNISNDEHLMELRDLISAGTNIQNRAVVGGMHPLLPNVCLMMMLGLPQFLGTTNWGSICGQLFMVNGIVSHTLSDYQPSDNFCFRFSAALLRRSAGVFCDKEGLRSRMVF